MTWDNSRTFLGGKMKIIITLLFMIFLSCHKADDESQSHDAKASNVILPALAASPTAEKAVMVDNFILELRDDNGRCVMLHKPRANTRPWESLDVGMAAPCEFIRTLQEGSKPLSYTYKTGKKRRTVLLITGGVPDPDTTDQFMPNGCGTWLARIRVFNDHVELEWSGENGPTWCPSSGGEEIFFAA